MSNNKTSYTLHFTIGPVQSFVGQARRTRDLWAGSFLLSWLSGQAMNAVIEAGGDIEFPVVQDINDRTKVIDPLLQAIRKQAEYGSPEIGTLPNRFKAILKFDDSVSTTENKKKRIQQITNAVTDKWEAIADAVWREYVQIHSSKETQNIWNKQIKHFWEINWVLAPTPSDKSDGKWLDLRKNWRSHWQKKQGGDHCTLMGDWQEISGYIRSHNKDEQDEFWDKIRNQYESGKKANKKTQKKLGYLELREGERLCAISLVKRLFPRLSEESLTDIIGWIPGGSKEAVGNWPSTAYMAAIPWLHFINEDNERVNALAKYAETVAEELEKLGTFPKLCSERATNISNLEALDKTTIGKYNQRNITDLDGNLFHLDTLQNHRNTPLSDEEQSYSHDPDKVTRSTLVSALKKVNKAIDDKDAQPFYALLVMDGDNMGKLLQDDNIDEDGVQAISKALMDFSLKAKDIVEKHQGILLYSGGDDVLAMLPITTAIDCSIELRQCYQERFQAQTVLSDHMDKISASAAIIYTHLHTPLNKVLKQGHHTLDNIAKEQNGRNSLCLTVFKPEGVTAQWVGSFGVKGEERLVENMQILIARMQCTDKDNYSTSFFYNLKARYPMLYDDKNHTETYNKQDKHALLLAEYCKGKNMKKQERKDRANNAINILLNACGKQKGKDEDDNVVPEIDLENHLQLDAAYIARFIIDTGYSFGRARGQE